MQLNPAFSAPEEDIEEIQYTPRIIEFKRNKKTNENDLKEFEKLEESLRNQTSLTSDFFPKDFSKKIYEIHFPKDSLLENLYPFFQSSSFIYCISLPPSLKIIHDYAFQNCYNLSQIDFLKDSNGRCQLTEIGEKAFFDTKIQSIIIPNSVKSIGSDCFPTTLQDIIFEDDNTKIDFIGHQQFRNSQLKSIVMPNNLDAFKSKNDFVNCKKLKEVTFTSNYPHSSDDNMHAEISDSSSKISIFPLEQTDMYYETTKREDLSSDSGRYDLEEPSFHDSIDYFQSKDFASILCFSNIETIHAAFDDLNHFLFYNTPHLKIDLSEGDQRYLNANGCIYEKDMKKLIFCERNVESATVSSECKIITNYAFNSESLKAIEFESDSNLEEISFGAFMNSSISTINLPNTIQSLGIGCFYKCKNLTKVSLSSSLGFISVADFAFTNLTAISIPDSVTIIDSYAFYKCENLSKVTFSDSSCLTSIGTMAFASTSISEITIPENVTSISPYAFYDCTKLAIFTFKDNCKLTTFHGNCLANTEIKEVHFHLVRSLESFNFYGLQLKILSFSNQCNFSNIPESLFACSAIEEIVLPPTVRIVHKKAFFKCLFLKKVHFTNDQLKIESNAFQYCENLEDLILPEKISLHGNNNFSHCKKLEIDLKLNFSATSITPKAFYNSGIRSLTIYNVDMLHIFEYAFASCPNLTQIKLESEGEDPNLHLHRFAFSDCINLRTFEYSANLEIYEIEEGCFKNVGLRTFKYPSKLVSIPESCFEHCHQLSEIIIDQKSCLKLIDTRAFFDSGLESFTAPSLLKLIQTNAFGQCKQLKSIDFHNLALWLHINNFAFTNIKIESLELTGRVYISPYSFVNCHNLKKIIFDSYSDYYDNLRFWSNIKQLYPNIIYTLHSSGNEDLLLSENQFYTFCQSNVVYSNDKKELLSIYYQQTEATIIKEAQFINPFAFQYSLIKKVAFEPNSGLDRIKNKAFAETGLEEIYLPNSLKLIEQFAFYRCKHLTIVHIEKESLLKRIGKHAFAFTNIETIVFPSKLEYIEENAFRNCTNLKTVTNFSNFLGFGDFSFAESAISSFKFPCESYFGFGSFSKCKNMKQLEFKDNPEAVIFDSDSFQFSGIESINLTCGKFDFKPTSFSYCPQLDKVVIEKSVEMNDFPLMAFAFSNVRSIIVKSPLRIPIYKLLDTHPASYYFPQLSYFEVHEIETHFIKSNTIIYSLNCLIVNGKLTSFDCFNCTLDNQNLSSVLRVPKCVTCFDDEEKFELAGNILPMHVKSIKFDQDYQLKSLGCEKLFAFSSLTEFIVPKTIESIPKMCFMDSHSLEKVIFEPNSSLKTIGAYAFANTKLKEIKIPESVEIIEDFAFYQCLCLTEATFSGKIVANSAFARTALKSFKISESIQAIGEDAFRDCHYLNQIIFCNNSQLETIGSFAFSETSIELFQIPRFVKVIEEGTFSGCQKLTRILISNKSTLKSIQKFACANAVSLELINLPKSIEKISSSAFINTPKLNCIMTESNDIYKIINSGTVYSKDRSLFFVPRNLKNVQILNKCLTIHPGAFCGDILQNVTFSDDNTLMIKHHAFAHCHNLKEITLPEKLRFLGDEAFIDCQNLKTVTFKSNCKLTFIPQFCFAFSGIKKLNLPVSIKYILPSSFYFCMNLSEINLLETKTQAIGHHAFASTALTEVKLPATVRLISSNAFENTQKLKTIDLTELEQIEVHKQEKDKIKVKSNLIKRTIKKEKVDIKIAIDKMTKSPKKRSKICLPPLRPNVTTMIHQYAFSHSSVEIIRVNDNKWCMFADFCKKLNTVIVNEKIKYSLKYIEKPSYHSFLDGNSTETLSKIQTQLIPSFRDNNSNYKSMSSKSKPPSHRSVWIDKSDYKSMSSKGQLQHFLLIDKSSKYQKYDLSTVCFNDNCFEIESIEYNETVKTLPVFLMNHTMKHFTVHNGITKINPMTFYACSNLTTIFFDDGIQLKVIPQSCFAFSGIESIKIPNSIEIIGYGAFSHCLSLKTVEIGKKSMLHTIQESAFYECRSLKSIYIPPLIKKLGKMAFQSCVNLSWAIFDDSADQLDLIPEFAFYNTSIKSIKMPKNLKTIGYWAFGNCRQLETIVFNDSLITIGTNSFYNDELIKEITLPDSLEVIADGAFFQCKSLQTVKSTINSQLISIYDDAFSYTQITSINLNQNAKIIGRQNTSSLLKISFYGVPSNFVTNSDGAIFQIFDKDEISSSFFRKMISRYYPSNRDMDTVHINDYIINDNPILKLVFAPRDLTSLTIPSNCQFLQEVNEMKDLKQLSYQEGQVTAIGNLQYFSHNMSITEITILAKKVFLSPKSFYGFTKLTTITFNETVFIKFIPEKCFMNCSSLKSITISAFCDKICKQAFCNCESLETVTFASKSSLNSIERSAFENCISLKSISIPKSCVLLQSYAFKNCKSLTSIKFKSADNLKSIGCYCFMNCSSLQSIDIPTSCKSINSYAFMNCVNLSKFEFDASQNNSYLQTISAGLFFNCSKLNKVVLTTSKLYSIGSELFMNCTNLKSVTIKANCSSTQITYIQNRAFYNCTALTNVQLLLDSPIIIQFEVFAKCPSLEIIEIPSFDTEKRLVWYHNDSFKEANENVKVKVQSKTDLFDIESLFTQGKVTYDLRSLSYYSSITY